MEVVEAPFVRVPFEALKKAAKERKTVVEEVESVVKDISRQAQVPGGGAASVAPTAMAVDEEEESEEGERESKAACASLDGLLSRLSNLKRKIEDSRSVEERLITRCRARLEHLVSLGQYDKERALSWNRHRMHRLVVDYLLRQGYHDSALASLGKHEGLEHFVELEIFQSAQEIIDSLREHRCDLALAWCALNRSKLKRVKSKFEFKLRIREFIHHVEKGDLSGAVRYARKHLAPWAGGHMHELQVAMATLIFGASGLSSPPTPARKPKAGSGKGEDAGAPPSEEQGTKVEEGERMSEGEGGGARDVPSDPLGAPGFFTFNKSRRIYGHLFEDAQWDKLILLFKRDMYQLYTLPADSTLATHLQAGLSALKTPMSYTTSCSKEDPLSLPPFRSLSKPLPYAKHSKSRLVCYVTKQVMNENNPPMVLPNGMVYSAAGLKAITTQTVSPRTGEIAEKVKCPRTGDVFDVSRLKRAYPL